MSTRRQFVTRSAAAASALAFPLAGGAQARAVKVGILHPVTGAVAYSGQQCREGAQMAIALGQTGERGDERSSAGKPVARSTRADGTVAPSEQLGLFGIPHPVVERLRALDINTMTPLQALEQLAKLVDEARAGQRNA